MFYVFRALPNEPWVVALRSLNAACLKRDAVAVSSAYTDLFAALAEAGHSDLFAAAATSLRFTTSPLAALGVATPPEGLLTGARHDLNALLTLLRRDWQAEAADILETELPPLTELAERDVTTSDLSQLLQTRDIETVLDALLQSYREHGVGDLARYPAFRWSGGALRGLEHPAWADADRLVGLEDPVKRLQANTEAFLGGRGAQHALLYGPRGSGKSTALRSLGGRYAGAGLRLVEDVAMRTGVGLLF